jgi:transcriptional regulator with GAF, ATPase, and Fis domain
MTKTHLDEDLNAMYLTDKMNEVPRQLTEHEDLEVLLETFSKQVEEVVNEAAVIEVRDVSDLSSWCSQGPAFPEQRSIHTGNRRAHSRLES